MLYMFNVTYTKTVNKAQDIVNQHFNADIPLLSFDRDQSLREHVSQVRETLGTIYQKAELMHNDLLSQLEPSMSAKIEDSNVQMEVEMEVVNELQKTYTGLLGESTPLVAVLLVKKGMVESALPHPARLQDLTVLDLCGNDLLQSTEGVCKALTGGESESDYDRAAQLVWETAEVLWPHFHGYVELIDEVQACIRGEESLDE
ncbi:single-pass membrane and coiled-coil domain-containing protein 3 [Amia ocellicauda]|uniref:single-pass membrane and coiled-coil domain-containing protein 3 n=1 Tax=Amia ocellicauda TaxID=2972642 RepID=UPI0034641ADA